MSRDPGRVMPWFPWWITDQLHVMRGWPLIGRAVYRELLDIQWLDGSLPADPEKLRALVGATSTQWWAAWCHIEPAFPVTSDGTRRNPQLENLRQQQYQRHQKRVHAGSLGGKQARKNRQKTGDNVVHLGGDQGNE